MDLYLNEIDTNTTNKEGTLETDYNNKETCILETQGRHINQDLNNEEPKDCEIKIFTNESTEVIEEIKVIKEHMGSEYIKDNRDIKSEFDDTNLNKKEEAKFDENSEFSAFGDFQDLDECKFIHENNGAKVLSKPSNDLNLKKKENERTFFIEEDVSELSLLADTLRFGEEHSFQRTAEDTAVQDFGSILCYDLWLSLTLGEDIGDVRLNNKNRLKWKQSNMRRHCMMALGVPFDIDEALPKQPPSLDKMAENGFKKADMEIIANRLDTTLSLSLCNISQSSMNNYSHSDLFQLSKLIDQTLEEVSLSIEYWRSKIRETEEGQSMYHNMIANLVSHTHKNKQSYTTGSNPTLKN